MNCYFLVLARDKRDVEEKIKELSSLKMPYLIICGERINHPRVVYRKPKGKYDAINYGAKLIPKEVDVVALNDVDTKIYNFHKALRQFIQTKATLLFTKVIVREGPQNLFLLIESKIRRWAFIVVEGDLMLIRRKALMDILPLQPCKAEDTYILFRILERKEKVVFSEECYCETSKTVSTAEEESYKRRTVNGVYQALSYTDPPSGIKLFYVLLPFFSPLLLILGEKGYYWAKGILLGFVDYLRGDNAGSWKPASS